MKKILHISFLITYLVFSVGLTTAVKYCGDEITDIQLINPIAYHESGCNCCWDVYQSSCCDTELKTVKIQDSHEISAFRTIQVFHISYFPVSLTKYLSVGEDNLINYQLDINHSPPDQPVYITNCTFLI